MNLDVVSPGRIPCVREFDRVGLGVEVRPVDAIAITPGDDPVVEGMAEGRLADDGEVEDLSDSALGRSADVGR